MTLPAPRTLRLAAVVLAAAAALAAWKGGEAPTVRILVLDVSRSVLGSEDAVREAVVEVDRGLRSGDRSGVVAFAANAAVRCPLDEGPLGERLRAFGDLELTGLPSRHPEVFESVVGESDIEAGIRMALGNVPEGVRGEILLATDGRATRGDAASAIADARRRGVAVRTIPLGATGLPLRIGSVEATSTARTGDSIPISVVVAGSPGAKGEIRLEDAAAGTSESRNVSIPEGGRARVVFSARAASAGVRRFRASAKNAGKKAFIEQVEWMSRGVLDARTVADAATAEAAVLVEDAAAILRLGREPAAAGTADLLRRLGGGKFEDAAGRNAIGGALRSRPLASWSAIVLDDLPERLLPVDAGEAIRREVEAGLGLVVFGGPQTLGPGGFAGRPIEEALPVRCAPDRPRPLVVLAVDVSGSMEGSGPEGDSPSRAARVAAGDLVGRLPADARIALVFFHDQVAEATEPFDLGTPAGKEAAGRAAAKVRPAGGGTRFAAAVEGALGALSKAPGSGGRLLLVVTDGRPADAPEDLRRLGTSLKEARFALRVVPVAPDSDAARLREFTGAADGSVESAGTGAAGLAETLAALAAGQDRALWSAAVEAVRPGADVPPFGAAPAGLPDAAGHDRVAPRPGAQVWLALAGGDPLLVAGRKGLGRGVVFAAPPAAGSAEWVAGPAASVLEAAARWTLRGAGREDVEATAVRLPDGSVRTALETLPASAPAGEVRVLGRALRRTGPARWEGDVPADVAKSAEVVAFEADGSPLARVAPAAAPSPEDAALGPDLEALRALSSPGRNPPGSGGAGRAAVAAALLSLLLLLAAAAAESRASRCSPSV